MFNVGNIGGNMENTIIITRHKGLVEYLKEKGLVNGNFDVIEHASIETVKGRHVIGVLPNHLAVHAKSLTEIPLNIPAELRGKELTAEQVREFAGEPATYVILSKKEYDAMEADAFIGAMTRGC